MFFFSFSTIRYTNKLGLGTQNIDYSLIRSTSLIRTSSSSKKEIDPNSTLSSINRLDSSLNSSGFDSQGSITKATAKGKGARSSVSSSNRYWDYS